ncbi:MAG: hypothetical protein H7Z12_05685 [Rhodospirillaceae bacterium]|nr:hypothetical protein [Rhodospirillales bacterium]
MKAADMLKRLDDLFDQQLNAGLSPDAKCAYALRIIAHAQIAQVAAAERTAEAAEQQVQCFNAIGKKIISAQEEQAKALTATAKKINDIYGKLR